MGKMTGGKGPTAMHDSRGATSPKSAKGGGRMAPKAMSDDSGASTPASARGRSGGSNLQQPGAEIKREKLPMSKYKNPTYPSP